MAGKKVGIYIDGDNFYHTQKSHLYFDIDARKIIEFCSQYGELVDVVYYLSTYDDSDDDRQSFSRALMNIGFKVERVPVKRINTIEGKKEKSQLDNHLIIDATIKRETMDTLILFSGDSDFSYLVKTFQNNGKRVIVCSANSAISEDLRMLVGQDYIDLFEKREELERKGDHMITPKGE
jgi:uncharacterized LabA/DUF88 family protein